MNKAKQLALGVRGAVCPSCGRDNSEYGNICTSDDCPGVNPSQDNSVGNCLTCGEGRSCPEDKTMDRLSCGTCKHFKNVGYQHWGECTAPVPR